MPALPLDDAGPYVAGAYLVFLALILIYVAIMASKLARIERELVELSELAERRASGRRGGEPDAADADRGGARDERADRARDVAQDGRRRGAREDRADRGGVGALHARAGGRGDDLRGGRRSRPATAPSCTSWSAIRSRRRASCSARWRGARACGRPSWWSGIYSLRNCDAARHLYRVASGLESMVIGEAEVQGQVKRAYEAALVGAVHRPADQQALPRRAGDRQARAHRHGDLRRPRLRGVGGRRRGA